MCLLLLSSERTSRIEFRNEIRVGREDSKLTSSNMREGGGGAEVSSYYSREEEKKEEGSSEKSEGMTGLTCIRGKK